MKTKTIHPCQPGKKPGEYDVMEPLPYPYHIDDTGVVLRQDFWRGTPSCLVGFQKYKTIQRVDVWFKDWFSEDVDVLGMYPVFLDAAGSLYTDTRPVGSV